MSRAEAAGDQRVIAGKIAARYSSEGEQEVIYWFKELLDFEVHPGMMGVMESLKNGQALVRLAMKIRDGTPDCPPKAKKMLLKPNTMSAPFKQMENIDNFVKFCEAFGVHRNSTFQTVDLFDGRNMAQVLSCIQTLGSEAQRHRFQGPCIGPKPTTSQRHQWTIDQLRAGHSMIGLQAGTNKYASQKGMSSMGAVRHVADIRADDLTKDGMDIIGGQYGFVGGDSQRGMVMGGVRHCADIRADDGSKEGQAVIGGQYGYTLGSSQKGMVMGGVRHGADIRADDASKEGSNYIGGQYGFTGGDSQKGMSAGVRHCADIRCDDLTTEGQSVIGGQYGYTGGSSQKGMVMGGVRHCADIRCDDLTTEGQNIIGGQYGYTGGDSQKGMVMGGVRHCADIRADDLTNEGAGHIGLQMGTTDYANQSGMSYGGRRDITRKGMEDDHPY